MDDIVLIYTTWPDGAAAEAFARGAVEAGVVACANVIGPVTSIYRWDGSVEAASEVVVILKTVARAAPALRERLLAEHPHETPCLLVMDIDRSLSDPAYAAWLESTIFLAGTRA